MKARVVETIVSSESFMMHHTRVIRHWLITIPGTSYRCEIIECPCGLRDQIGVTYVRVDPTDPDYNTRTYGEIEDIHSVPRVECLCTARSCKLGVRAHKCHGWHGAKVDQLIRSIEKLPAKHHISTSMRSYRTESTCAS